MLNISHEDLTMYSDYGEICLANLGKPLARTSNW